MATCPKCFGALTEHHRCPKGRLSRVTDALGTLTIGGAIGIVLIVIWGAAWHLAEVSVRRPVRVLAAIANQDQDWRAAGNRQFRKAFFGPSNSPYQFTAVGTKENVERLSPQNLRKWYDEKVMDGRKVLAIYGQSGTYIKFVGKPGLTDPKQAKKLGIVPGSVSEFSTEQMLAGVTAATPVGRLGTSEDVAEVIVFLCTDAARFIVGQMIEVNGGFLMV